MRDIILINANKRHLMNGREGLLAARFEIDFHVLAEHMETMQLLFWCNTAADKNEAYQELRLLLDQILARYFEKEEKGALHLNALYYETAYLLTSNFFVKTDDARVYLENTQDKQRIRQIQNYIQANYQSEISLKDLASRLFLSNAYLKWYFEIWSQEKDEMGEKDDSYFTFFDIAYCNLKGISPGIRVGGAGFILGYETREFKEIFERWKERQITPDFLSVYSYQYTAVVEGEQIYGRKSIDRNYMKNQLAIMKEKLAESGLEVDEIHISEWNFTISNRNLMHDSCEQGAYVLKNCIDMNGEVDRMAYWHALDNYSDYYDAEPLQLGFRLKNVKNGNYLVKTLRVNRVSGSAQDIWRSLEYSKNLSKDEMSYLRKSAIPKMEMHHTQVDNECLEIENTLMEQEIRLLDIRYRYTAE